MIEFKVTLKRTDGVREIALGEVKRTHAEISLEEAVWLIHRFSDPDRFFAMGSDDTVFQMVIDQTFDTPADDNPNNPIVYNFIISQYPDETTEIERFAAMSDDEIVEQALADFTRVVLRWNVPSQKLPERTQLLPGGGLGAFTSEKIVRPPHSFRLSITLFNGDADTAPSENFSLDFSG